MGPSVSFPVPLRIAQKLPIRNFWELCSESYRYRYRFFGTFNILGSVSEHGVHLQLLLEKCHFRQSQEVGQESPRKLPSSRPIMEKFQMAKFVRVVISQSQCTAAGRGLRD